jgi:hypothetical protein
VFDGGLFDRSTLTLLPVRVGEQMVDEDKLNQLVGEMLNDLGGAFSVPMARMGDRLGLYKALDDKGPMTSKELAKEAGIAERYAREWLSHQAASGYLDYDPVSASSP